MIILKMTILLAILAAGPEGKIGLMYKFLGVCALFHEKTSKSSALWLGLTALQFFGVFYNWGSADNHKYIIAYWFFAIYLSLLYSKGDMKN